MAQGTTPVYTRESPLIVRAEDGTTLNVFQDTGGAATGGSVAPLEHLRWIVSANGDDCFEWDVIDYMSDSHLEKFVLSWWAEGPRQSRPFILDHRAHHYDVERKGADWHVSEGGRFIDRIPANIAEQSTPELLALAKQVVNSHLDGKTPHGI